MQTHDTSQPADAPERAPEILVLSKLEPAAAMAELSARFTCYNAFESPGLEALVGEHGHTIRGLVTTGGRGADARLIDSLPALELITVYGVGVDAIDFATVRRRGISVTNTPDVLTDDVADLAIGLFLAATRLIAAGDRAVRAGQWSAPLQSRLPLSARGRKVGIVGMGRIGKAIARRLAVFDAEIAYCKSKPASDIAYRYFPDPVSLAAYCEVLFIAVPGGAGTFRLIDRRVLDALGPGGLLVNVSRGSVVDEAALVAALESNSLGAAALDVFADEPNVPAELLRLENVVLTPHIGSFTYETRLAMGQLVIQNADAYFGGRALLTRVE